MELTLNSGSRIIKIKNRLWEGEFEIEIGKDLKFKYRTILARSSKTNP